jgi:hypothetical protein
MRVTKRAGHLLTATSTMVLAGAACSGPTPSTTFVATLGATDTVAVETYTRGADRVSGTSVGAFPRAAIRSYGVSFDSDGALERAWIEEETGVETVEFRYSADSVIVRARRDTAEVRFAIATRGARPLPMASDVFGFWEIALAPHAEGPPDSATIGVVTGARVQPIAVHRTGPGRVSFGYDEWGTALAYFGEVGRLDSLDLTGTTTRYRVSRRPPVDIEGLRAAWAGRPDPGGLSPRDTADAVVAGAHIAVDYGRPAMRGRRVFGGIVPWNEVWRLGANAATQLVTDRDLVMDGTPVPAGTYTLWTVPSPTGWTIMLNTQHGQWGTRYDPERDHARLRLTPATLGEPVERLTITVDGAGGREGILTIAWETTLVSIPFTVAPATAALRGRDAASLRRARDPGGTTAIDRKTGPTENRRP